MTVNIFIQARMSSSRYPGKVLAPVFGIPLIKNLVDRAQQVKNKNKVIVLTSAEISDDPLAVFLKSIHCEVFRGPLSNVFGRFQEALSQYPCEYFVRLCGDSPFIDPSLIQTIIEKGVEGKYDLISNVFGKKFPKGQAVEMVRSSVFKAVNSSELTEEEREHVIPYFYKHREMYRTIFFELINDMSHINQCIDTLEDIKNIQAKSSQYFFDENNLCVMKKN